MIIEKRVANLLKYINKEGLDLSIEFFSDNLYINVSEYIGCQEYEHFSYGPLNNLDDVEQFLLDEYTPYVYH